MDVSAWLNRPVSAGRLFPTARRQGRFKRLLGRLLGTANAGVAGPQLSAVREEFYALKARLLEEYGEPCGTDWQVIERSCYGCDACCGGYYGRDAACDGKGVFSRRYIPLARTKLGRVIFHTPGAAQWQKPAGPIKFTGRVPHREVSDEDARAAFLILCLMFDRELFRAKADKLFALKPWGYDR
jgi:hypothetical protein